MGDELEDFGSDVIVPEIEEKYKIEMEDFRIGYDKLKRWAYDDYGKRAMEHPYEDPWRSGWIIVEDVDGNEHKFSWYLKDSGEIEFSRR